MHVPSDAVRRRHDTSPTAKGTGASVIESLDPAARTALVARLRPCRFRRGDAVYNEGDRGDCLHLVQAGHLDVQVSTPDGTSIVVRVVHPGEFVGELALIRSDHQRTERVCAIEPAETLALSGADFAVLRREHTSLDRLLVTLLAEQVVHADALLLEMLMPAETRVWRRLAELADAYVDGTIRMSQDELAHIAGTGRQTANRVLRAGVRQGVLAVGRSSVQVLDRAALDRLAGQRGPSLTRC